MKLNNFVLSLIIIGYVFLVIILIYDNKQLNDGNQYLKDKIDFMYQNCEPKTIKYVTSY